MCDLQRKSDFKKRVEVLIGIRSNGGENLSVMYHRGPKQRR